MAQNTDNTGNNVGSVMEDGTVFAGISPKTGAPMYAMPHDFGVTMDFNEASRFAKTDKGYGHDDWHLPTDKELQVLSDNKDAIGGFDTSGTDETGWYWSSTEKNPLRDGRHLTAVAQRFGEMPRRFSFRKHHPADTKQYPILKQDKASLRLVRTPTP